ncbi:hypothetical protein [Peribacillus frigoritolerans]|uniref:hypothetical protein n=1 Tax=Peribacillus frigoritolerans TaxID=450367 RepID=UPI00399F8319
MHTDTLKRDWHKSVPKEDIVRKIYISFPTKAFEGKEDVGFQICDEISKFFEIPFNSVQVVGSAKTGKSYYKFTDFAVAKSDLDIAIISPELFLKYTEICHRVTKGYSDQSMFSLNRHGKSDIYEFKKNLTQGMFRPDLMPNSPSKDDWRRFFNKLSNKHHKLFKNINAGIYSSQYFFEYKQIDALFIYMNRIGGIHL